MVIFVPWYECIFVFRTSVDEMRLWMCDVLAEWFVETDSDQLWCYS